MPSHIFDAIRTGCAEVARRASAVNIRRERINAYAAELAPTGSFPRPFLEPEHHHLGHGPATVAYILTLDAVNFGSGYFADLHPRDGLTGYFLVATALRDRFRSHGPWSADELCEMSPEQCASSPPSGRRDATWTP